MKTVEEASQEFAMAAAELRDAIIKAWHIEDFCFWLNKKVAKK